MNTVLWIVQVVLAVKLLSSAYTHALRPDPAKMQRGMQRLGTAARPLLIVIALCMVLGAFTLVLPAALGIWLWLTPWAAAGLAVLMLVGVWFHVRCRENPKIVVGLVLFALAAFLAFGRWVIAPS